VRSAARPGWRAAGAALRPDDGSDRLPRRQGSGDPSAGAGAWRPGVGAAELAAGRGGGLARALGAEPDADPGDHAPLRPGGAPARGRCAGGCRLGGLEVRGVAAIRGAVGGTPEGVAGRGPLAARPAGRADRRHPSRRGFAAGRSWSRPSASTARARSTRSAWSRERRRTPRWCRRCSTTW
jgi:hypothetical protein